MSSDDWIEELKAEVRAELEGEFAHRLHYSKGTYADGCRGPLCRKAERDATKDRQEARERVTGLPYRPLVDTPQNCLRDDFLNNIIWQHRNERGKPVLPRRPVYPEGWFDTTG